MPNILNDTDKRSCEGRDVCQAHNENIENCDTNNVLIFNDLIVVDARRSLDDVDIENGDDDGDGDIVPSQMRSVWSPDVNFSSTYKINDRIDGDDDDDDDVTIVNGDVSHSCLSNLTLTSTDNNELTSLDEVS